MVSSKTGPKILVIEDDESISNAVNGGLTIRNYQVTVINNGKTALRTIENLKFGNYDLILLDLMLPGANGWEILIKIRSQQATVGIPVIMLTAVDDDMSESRALCDGADDYITKPFSMKVLAARIEACLCKKAQSSFLNFDLHFTDGDIGELTNREKVILGYVAKGYTNKEIAKFASISEITVGNHITNIFNKLKVHSRTQAAILAIKYNLYD
ncbi:MAG: response regulator transcription factor [Cyanobacteriota bacterium]